MINVKVITKSKDTQQSGGNTSGGSSQAVLVGTVEEAKHAYDADRATNAEYADKSGYADQAGNALHADTAETLSEESPIFDKFIRKDVDDVGEGNYEFEQDFQVDGDTTLQGTATVSGDATFSADADVAGTLKTDEIQSHTSGGDIEVLSHMVADYIKTTGGTDLEELFGEGFLMKRDDDNKAHVFTDYLTVRLKAYFAELEIRRLSYVGGSIVLTPAGSKVAHVKWLDANGNELDKTDGNRNSVKAFKVYELADDGTLATQNGWQAGDQARCQTFNLDGAGKYQDVSNTYYWRLVTASGQERVLQDFTTVLPGQTGYDDAQVASYIILSNQASVTVSGTTCVGYDTTGTNDFPADADVLVQMGNQLTPSTRGNVIMLRTTDEGTGDGVPSITMYHEVGSSTGGTFPYTLSGHAMFSVSPSGFEVLTKYFLLKTSPSDPGTTIAQYKGDWVSTSTYLPGDTVTYGGYMWRCKVEGSNHTPEDGVWWAFVNVGIPTAVWELECDTGVINMADTYNNIAILFGLASGGTDYAVDLGDDESVKFGESTPSGGIATATCRSVKISGDTREYIAEGTIKAECMDATDVLAVLGTSATGMLSFNYSDIVPGTDYVRFSLTIDNEVVATTDVVVVEMAETDGIADTGSTAVLSMVQTPQGTSYVLTGSLIINIGVAVYKALAGNTEHVEDTTGYTMEVSYRNPSSGAMQTVTVQGGEGHDLEYNESFTGLGVQEVANLSQGILVSVYDEAHNLIGTLTVPLTGSSDSMFSVTDAAFQSWYLTASSGSMLEQTAERISMLVAGLGASGDGQHYSSFDISESQVTVDTANFLVKYGDDSFLLFGEDGKIHGDFISITADRIDFTGFTSINGMTVDLEGNLTVDGVINNNLMVVAQSESTGVRACKDVFSCVETGSDIMPSDIWLDPLRLGRMVKLTSAFNGHTIRLPWAEKDNTGAVVYGFTGYEGEGNLRRVITLDELRKCVGKVFTFLNDDGDQSHEVIFRCTDSDSQTGFGWIVTETDTFLNGGAPYADFSQLTMNANHEITRTWRREIEVGLTAQHWLELEFCMAVKEGAEFFYWKARHMNASMIYDQI